MECEIDGREVRACVYCTSRSRLKACLIIMLDAVYFSELCWGKAVVAYTMPQQRKKEESERLRERDQIKFIDLGFERLQVVRFRKARGRQEVP